MKAFLCQNCELAVEADIEDAYVTCDCGREYRLRWEDVTSMTEPVTCWYLVEVLDLAFIPAWRR